MLRDKDSTSDVYQREQERQAVCTFTHNLLFEAQRRPHESDHALPKLGTINQYPTKNLCQRLGAPSRSSSMHNHSRQLAYLVISRIALVETCLGTVDIVIEHQSRR